MNQLVYQNAEGTLWGNTLIAPILFITAISLLSLMSKTQSKKRFQIIICISLLSTIMFNIYNSCKLGTHFTGYNATPRFNLTDIQAIKQKLKKASQPGYIVTMEYLMGAFMERSHVSIDWIFNGYTNKLDALLRNSDYIILLKNEPLVRKLQHENQNYTILETTETLICFQPKKG